jgi:hypothetical protein
MRRTLGGLTAGRGETRDVEKVLDAWMAAITKATGTAMVATEASGGVTTSGAFERIGQQSDSADVSVVSGRQQPCSPANAAVIAGQGQRVRRTTRKDVTAVPAAVASSERLISIR